MTGVEILLACLVCLVALIFWLLRPNGNRNRQRPVNEHGQEHSREISTVKPRVTREPWMNKCETAVGNLNNELQNIPDYMRIFSTAMRSLYAEKQVNAEAATAEEFLSLRDDTKRDALVYVNGILPVSVKLVRFIGEFCDLYETFGNLQTWRNNLPNIIEEVKGYRQCCEEVVRLHKDIMGPLKDKEDRAKCMVKKMGNLTTEYEEKLKELEQKATGKREMGKTFAQIPELNLIVAPFLFRGANLADAEAIATKFQISISKTATLAVGRTMVPALTSFIKGLETAAGFFAIMEKGLTTFYERGEMTSPHVMELHLTIMKKKAREVKHSCQSFFGAVSAVTSDFSCVPSTTSDNKYVDKWLEEQRRKIKNRYRHNITKKLKHMITYWVTTSEENE